MVAFSHLVGPGFVLQPTAESTTQQRLAMRGNPGRLPGRGRVSGAAMGRGRTGRGGGGGDGQDVGAGVLLKRQQRKWRVERGRGTCCPRQEGEQDAVKAGAEGAYARGALARGSDQSASLRAPPALRPGGRQRSALGLRAAAGLRPAAPPSRGDPGCNAREGGALRSPRSSSHGAGAHRSRPQDRTRPLGAQGPSLSRLEHGHSRRLRGQEDTCPGTVPRARRPGPGSLSDSGDALGVRTSGSPPTAASHTEGAVTHLGNQPDAQTPPRGPETQLGCWVPNRLPGGREQDLKGHPEGGPPCT